MKENKPKVTISNKGRLNGVNFTLNIEALKLIGNTKYIAFDYINFIIKVPDIDTYKTYRIGKYGSFCVGDKFLNYETWSIIGDYDIKEVSEGVFQLTKIALSGLHV